MTAHTATPTMLRRPDVARDASAAAEEATTSLLRHHGSALGGIEQALADLVALGRELRREIQSSTELLERRLEDFEARVDQKLIDLVAAHQATCEHVDALTSWVLEKKLAMPPAVPPTGGGQ
jgi:hypothetical protein